MVITLCKYILPVFVHHSSCAFETTQPIDRVSGGCGLTGKYATVAALEYPSWLFV